MKTSEELQAMSHEELIEYTYSLQESLEKSKNDSEFWYRSFMNESNRLAHLKNTVKSVVELIEIPKHV